MKHLHLFLCAGALALGACNAGKNKDAPGTADTLLYDSTQENRVLESAKKMFYAMPSPLEMSTLIKSAGGEFRSDLLHDPNQAPNYQTLQQRSMVLGVYGADLSYASVFDRQQDAVKFLAASKRIGEDIGIRDVFSANILERANNNLNNRDSMLHILTEVYWETNSQLKEENRDQISLLVMAGGWAEGLYMGTQLIDPAHPDPEIATRVIEQKYTAMQLQEMFNEFSDNELISASYPIFAPALDFFASLNVKEEEKTSVSTNSEGVMTIGGKKTIAYTAEDLKQLQLIASTMRTKIIAL